MEFASVSEWLLFMLDEFTLPGRFVCWNFFQVKARQLLILFLLCLGGVLTLLCLYKQNECFSCRCPLHGSVPFQSILASRAIHPAKSGTFWSPSIPDWRFTLPVWCTTIFRLIWADQLLHACLENAHSIMQLLCRMWIFRRDILSHPSAYPSSPLVWVWWGQSYSFVFF